MHENGFHVAECIGIEVLIIAAFVLAMWGLVLAIGYVGTQVKKLPLPKPSEQVKDTLAKIFFGIFMILSTGCVIFILSYPLILLYHGICLRMGH